MNISMVGRRVELSEAIKGYIEKTVSGFEKFNLDITSVHVVVSKDEKHKKPSYEVEFILSIANQDNIVVKQSDLDLYAAIDLASSRVEKVLRRHSDKIKSHKAQKLTSIEIENDENLKENERELENEEIIPVKLASYKPISIEEALNELKQSDDIFKVFYDLDEKLRVLYKMKDGKHFGLF